MDDLHTSALGHTPRLTADPSQEGILRIQEMERRLLKKETERNYNNYNRLT